MKNNKTASVPYNSKNDDNLPKLQESPSPSFVASPKAMFSTRNTKTQSQMTTFEKISLIRSGISKTEFEGFKQKAGLDYDQLSAALSVARATLINKKGTEKFNSSLSEKILSLADIYAYGYEVFEDTERFNKWIFRPNQALGGLPPFDFLDNQYGREEIKDLIGRIDYGVYS